MTGPSQPVTASPHSSSLQVEAEEVSCVDKHISKCWQICCSCVQYCFAVANQTLFGCCSKASKLAVLPAALSHIVVNLITQGASRSCSLSKASQFCQIKTGRVENGLSYYFVIFQVTDLSATSLCHDFRHKTCSSSCCSTRLAGSSRMQPTPFRVCRNCSKLN